MSTLQGLDSTLAEIREARALRERQRDDLLGQAKAVAGEIRRLDQAERALMGTTANGNGHGGRTSIEVVEAYMREKGTATQSDVAKMLDKPKNTAKHALRVLTERGVIRPTGVMDRRSPQYALVDGAA